MNDGIHLVMGEDGAFREMPEPYMTLYIGSEEEWETLKDAADRGCKMRWISVKDRMPEIRIQNSVVERSDVVLATDGVSILMGYFKTYRCDGSCYFVGYDDSNDNTESETITYWMPLPEPPKEEKS